MLIQAIIYLVVVGIIFGLLWWLVGFAASKGVLPPPFVGIAQVLIALVAVLLLISFVMQLSGHPIGGLRLL